MDNFIAECTIFHHSFSIKLHADLDKQRRQAPQITSFFTKTDSSQEGQQLAVRYLSPTEGIQNGLLGFYKDEKETSEAIVVYITDMLNNSGLGLDNVSA